LHSGLDLGAAAPAMPEPDGLDDWHMLLRSQPWMPT
jgi:hypothetical protein